MILSVLCKFAGRAHLSTRGIDNHAVTAWLPRLPNDLDNQDPVRAHQALIDFLVRFPREHTKRIIDMQKLRLKVGQSLWIERVF